MANQSGPSGSTIESQGLVLVEKDKVMKDVVVVTLNRSPSNILNTRLLRELIMVLDDVEANANYRGLILTSSITNVFCNGLDIADLYKKSFDKFRDFWKALQDLWVRLYLSRLVTIAAINGTAVAGGCLLAISCDYRIMAKGPFSIGLPETIIGLFNSVWVYEMLSRLIGSRQAEMCLQLAIEYPVKDAAEIRLIDMAVPPKKLIEACREEMSKWLRIPGRYIRKGFSRAKTKHTLREPVVLKLLGNPEGDTQNMYTYISQPVVQETLENVLKKFGLLEKKAGKK